MVIPYNLANLSSSVAQQIECRLTSAPADTFLSTLEPVRFIGALSLAASASVDVSLEAIKILAFTVPASVKFVLQILQLRSISDQISDSYNFSDIWDSSVQVVSFSAISLLTCSAMCIMPEKALEWFFHSLHITRPSQAVSSKTLKSRITTVIKWPIERLYSAVKRHPRFCKYTLIACAFIALYQAKLRRSREGDKGFTELKKLSINPSFMKPNHFFREKLYSCFFSLKIILTFSKIYFFFKYMENSGAGERVKDRIDDLLPDRWITVTKRGVSVEKSGPIQQFRKGVNPRKYSVSVNKCH